MGGVWEAKTIDFHAFFDVFSTQNLDCNLERQKIEKKISNPIKPKSNNLEKDKKTTDLKSKLQYLRELLDSGLITKEEYDKKRLSLLDQI